MTSPIEKLQQECDERPAELNAGILMARVRELEQALRDMRIIASDMADFAVGHGDVCEIIAKHLRAVLHATDKAVK